MSEETSLSVVKPKSSFKERIVYTVKILFTLLILYILLNSINREQLFSTFLSANYSLIGISIILGAINIYFQFYKWKIICDNSLNEPEEKKIWYSLFYGFAGAVVTPFRIGEYAGRAVAFRNSDIVKITVATLADKFFSLIVILISGSCAVLIYLKISNYINYSVFVLLMIVITGIILAAKWLISNGSSVKLKTIHHLKNFKILSELMKRADSFSGLTIKIRYRLLLFSLLAFLCYTAQYSFLVASLSHQWSLHLYLLAGILTIFTKTIIPPFTFGELGIREGASVFFITQIGLPGVIGFNAAILLFFLNIAIPGIIGALLLLKRN